MKDIKKNIIDFGWSAILVIGIFMFMFINSWLGHRIDGILKINSNPYGISVIAVIVISFLYFIPIVIISCYKGGGSHSDGR